MKLNSLYSNILYCFFTPFFFGVGVEFGVGATGLGRQSLFISGNLPKSDFLPIPEFKVFFKNVYIDFSVVQPYEIGYKYPVN